MADEELLKLFNEELTPVWCGDKPNQYTAKPVQMKINQAGVEKFNKLYKVLNESDFKTIIRTPSGGISTAYENRIRNYRAWDVVSNKIGIRITILFCGFIYVLKLGSYLKGEKETTMYPSQAFALFEAKCKECGINLNDYRITNGAEVKKTIESPLIYMNQHMTVEDAGLTDVHHIDFHNSYPAGLANTHPEFRPVVEYFYNKRKEDESCKFVLNCTIGYMQSLKNYREAEWAHLSRDAIADNNRRVTELATILELTGRNIIGFNTDGIWYQGEIYHGEDEGPGLGQWHNDHVNCIFRSKSNGAYEFIEDGKYHAVVRGTSTYDVINPDRTEWSWGDIYKANILTFRFDEGVGIIYENESESN